jgi:hypothetical protein
MGLQFLNLVRQTTASSAQHNLEPEYLSIATRLSVGRPELDFQQGQGIFLFVTALRPVLRPTQPPTQEDKVARA